jgi:dsRNA-specific ribonuclease
VIDFKKETTLLKALMQITECTLATVEHLAMLKSAKKSELKRQISIAQDAMTTIRAAMALDSDNLPIKTWACPKGFPRVRQLLESGKTVRDFAIDVRKADTQGL